MLYKIGEFAKLTNIPVKTLRYYDEINLLKPEEIDLFSGYRYYSDKQKEGLEIILALKEAGFSLEEIKKNKDNYSDEIMLLKKETLLREQERLDERIKKLDYLRNHIIDKKIILNGNIKEEPRKLERLR
mgnify:FL=1